MIDVNVFLSRWPFRRLPHDEPESLARSLRDSGVSQAWAGSFDALLHRDLAAVNARLAEDCQRYGSGLFVPFGTVNPRLPDWREDLRRCHEVHRMPGLRLHPNYHGYTLDDPAFSALLADAEARQRIVQLVLTMEDERTQHPLLRVPQVDPSPLTDLLSRFPRLKLVLLNALGRLRGEALSRLLPAGDVSVEVAMLEGAAGLNRLIPEVGIESILFGSLSPLFTFASARLKLQESSLSDEQRMAITEGNARRLLPNLT